MTTWTRVTKKDPCPVCGKGDWCCIGQYWVNCMRVSGPRAAANGGWLHPIHGLKEKPLQSMPKIDRKPSINATALVREWKKAIPTRDITILAGALCLSAWSLRELGVCWAPPHGAWCFPMVDAYGSTVGIRLRGDDGRKWAVRGSRQGMFMGRGGAQETVWVTEGPTDAAAGLELGLFTIGRPSCRGCINDICTAIRRADSRRAVILSDNDSPGHDGALQLAAALHIPSVIICPPAKDLRSYVTKGGTGTMLGALLTGQTWKQPKR